MTAPKPNVVLVGAAKAGTTSIHHYLKEHPQVFLPAEMKEINFLGGFNPAVRSEADYLALYTKSEVFPVRMDISTAYFYDPAAPERIRDFLGPVTKIIIFLRDPVETSYSMWKQIRYFGDEPLSFEDALMAEDQRRRDPAGLKGWPSNYFYRDRSLYAPQLQRYYDTFPASQIKVFIFEDFFGDLGHGWKDLCAFLNIDHSFVPKNLGNIYNPGSAKHRSEFLHGIVYRHLWWKRFVTPLMPQKMKAWLRQIIYDLNKKKDEDNSISPGLRRELTAAFTPDVAAVEKITGYSLKGIWLNP